MIRALVALIVPFVALTITACNKKKDTSSTEPSDPTEYTILIKEPGIGVAMKGALKIEMKIDFRMTGMGKIEEKNQDIHEEFTYRETALEKPPDAKRPTRSKILIEKWESRDPNKTISLQEVRERIIGREVVVTKVGERYEFLGTDGQPLDAGVTIYIDELLTKMMDSMNIEDLLPKTPVRRFSPWDVPVEKMMKALAKSGKMNFDLARSKATAQLTSVSERDGRKYGRIEIKTSIQLPEFPPEVQVKHAKVEVSQIIDACIDGTFYDLKGSGKFNVRMELDVPQERAAMNMRMTGEISFTGVQDDKKK